MNGIRAIARILVLSMVVSMPSGCNRSDERLMQLSQQTVERQAEQNRQVARQNEQLSQAASRLVEADATARQQWIASQGETQRLLQSERLGLNERHSDLQRRHDALETERRQIAQHRHRDPIVAGALVQSALLLACSLPILFCFCLLRALRQDGGGGELIDLLVEDVVDAQAMLPPQSAPARVALGHQPLPRPPDSDAR